MLLFPGAHFRGIFCMPSRWNRQWKRSPTYGVNDKRKNTHHAARFTFIVRPIFAPTFAFNRVMAAAWNNSTGMSLRTPPSGGATTQIPKPRDYVTAFSMLHVDFLASSVHCKSIIIRWRLTECWATHPFHCAFTLQLQPGRASTAAFGKISRGLLDESEWTLGDSDQKHCRSHR